MESGWIALIVLVGACVFSWLWSLLTAPRFSVHGKHVLFTGTETPLGLAVAKKYVKKGANVTLIGPAMEILEATQSELQKVAGENASVFVFECELVDMERVEQAVQEANATSHGSRRVRSQQTHQARILLGAGCCIDEGGDGCQLPWCGCPSQGCSAGDD